MIVLAEIFGEITADSTERSICNLAARKLAEQGITETWYYSCPALVLLGSRSCESISGRDYIPSDEAAGDLNLITIDLSPRRGVLWGDCARSIFIEDGVAKRTPESPEFCDGFRFLAELHSEMRMIATCDTTFGELHEFANTRITAGGFENLDYLGNVGHSIETRMEERFFH